MLSLKVRKALSGLLVASAGVLGLAAQSQAAVFVGTFDPPFGGTVTPLANLGFRGTATFYVPDACLSDYNGFHQNGLGCTAVDKIKMLSATVELYDSQQPPFQATLDTIAFPYYLFPNFSSANDVLIVGGNVVGVDTGIVMAPVNANVPEFYSGPIGLSFFQPCVYELTNYCGGGEGGIGIGAGGADPAHIWVCDPLSLNSCNLIPSAPAIVTISRVPEPASLALVLSALVAGGVGTLRRRRQQA